MKRGGWWMLLLCCISAPAWAQYPLTRTFELRSGQQRPHIQLITQDAQGVLWVASDQGLARSDGERTELIWAAVNGDAITALCSDGLDVWAALASGHLMHARGYACDTLGRESELLTAPARAMVHDADGTLWIATYGAGLILHSSGPTRHIDVSVGLRDGHVNALCAAGKGRVLAATDQGIALCSSDGKVMKQLGEDEGLPDNLVLSLAPAGEGAYWAGTHHSGVFRFRPYGEGPHIFLPDSAWRHGAVTSLAAGDGRVWAGTPAEGVVVLDTRRELGIHVQPIRAGMRPAPIAGMLRDRDGAVWWCDGSEQVVRAEPDVLVVPGHEGVDLQHITALCTDAHGDLVLATSTGLFRHASVFADRLLLTKLPVVVDVDRPIVSLLGQADGDLWIGTFGMGVLRLSADGKVQRFTEKEGLCNDNVLAIASRKGADGEEIWFATLGGVCTWNGRRFTSVPIPGSGFVYDVQPASDGRVLVATDGNGVIAIGPDGAVKELHPAGSATYYSLCADAAGHVWASGPNTGICRVDPGGLQCSNAGKPPFDGDVFAIAPFGHQLLTFGRNGVAAFDPANGRLVEVGDVLGLHGIEAELNTTCMDADGSLWVACDRGLVRLSGADRLLDETLPAAITGFNWGDQQLPMEGKPHLRHDQDFLTFRFAAPCYNAPGTERFEYRLLGFDNSVRTTRDREVTWSRLPPGDYRFEVRAVRGVDPARGEWAGLSFTIGAPWWRTPWAVGGTVVVLTILFYLFIRAREKRLQYRAGVERERVRYQLEALRSQVNPHFLFNSFNTLIDLIEQDREKAVAHAEHLSDFFREILQMRDKELIPLAEELHLVDTYFYLEQRRFGDRIAMRKDVDAGAMQLAVPPLAVQLLVENAIKHNVATAETPLLIELIATDGALEVRNTFRPRESATRSTGFGITSIQQRYAALTTRPVEVRNDGTYFLVRIPLLPLR